MAPAELPDRAVAAETLERMAPGGVLGDELTGGLVARAWRAVAPTGHAVLRWAPASSTAAADRRRLQLEHHVLERLAIMDVHRVPRILAPAVLDDAGEWTLLSWVPGKHAASSWSLDDARAVGRLLRRVHDALDGWAPEDAPTVRYDEHHLRTCVAAVTALCSDSEASVLRQHARSARNALRRAWSGGTAVIHADPHDGNVVWDDGAPGLIDFARCGLGPAALDVAMAQHYLDDAAGAALLDGYVGDDRPPPIDPLSLPGLRAVAAFDNFATLAAIPAELPWVRRHIDELMELTRGAGD